MPESIVNLTVPIVIEEIEIVLDESTDSYRRLFLIPDLHQELVAYVLSRVRNRYGVVEKTEDGSDRVKPVTVCSEERLKIHDLAFQGIHSILQLHRDLLDRHRSLSTAVMD